MFGIQAFDFFTKIIQSETKNIYAVGAKFFTASFLGRNRQNRRMLLTCQLPRIPINYKYAATNGR